MPLRVDDEHLERLALRHERLDRNDDRVRARRDGDRAEHRLADAQRPARRRRLHADRDAARRRVDRRRDVDDRADAERLAGRRCARAERAPSRRDARAPHRSASRSAACRAPCGSAISTSGCDGSTDAPSVAVIRVTTPVIGELDGSTAAPRAAPSTGVGARLRRVGRRRFGVLARNDAFVREPLLSLVRCARPRRAPPRRSAARPRTAPDPARSSGCPAWTVWPVVT